MENRIKMAVFAIGAAAVLTILGSIVRLAGVETDLTTRGKSGLNAGAQSWAEISLDGRDATITGLAPTIAAQQLAEKSLYRVWGIRDITDKSKLLPEQIPYQVFLNRNGNEIELTGHVPRRPIRQAILTATKSAFPDGGLTYNLPLARGAPAGLDQAAVYSLDVLKDIAKGRIVINGNSLEIAGQASDSEAYERLVARSEDKTPVGYSIDKIDVTPPNVSPYKWSAKRTDKEVVLDGFTESNKSRQGIVTKTKNFFEESALNDQMAYGAGAPDGYDAAIGFALDQLRRMSSGTVSLEGAALTIKGTAASQEDFDALERALRAALPMGVTLAAREINAPPPKAGDVNVESVPTIQMDPSSLWSVTRSRTGVVLAGKLPDEQARGEIFALASAKFGSIPVQDRQEIAADLPDGYMDAVRAALQAVSRLGEGGAQISPETVRLTGSAFYKRAAESLRDRLLEGLPPGFNADLSALNVRQPGDAVSPEACQSLFKEILDANRIQFETAKSVIRRNSFGLLDRLVYATQRCPDARVLIEGHTDADGTDEANQVLSELRASSVMGYLVAAGIPKPRLKSVGYGEQKPIASNETDAGKARNRRIEFRIVQQ